MTTTNRLGELLVREKLISQAQLRLAQEEQQKTGKNLGATLAKLGYITEEDITTFLSQQYRVPTVNLEDDVIAPDILKLVQREQCERHCVIPVSHTDKLLMVAMADPTNLNAIDDLKFLTGYNIDPVIASETAITTAIKRYYTETGPSYEEVIAGFDEYEIEVTDDDVELTVMGIERGSKDSPIVRLVNMILLNAIKKGASDIHIEPYEGKYRVRYRIDGALQEEMAPPRKLAEAVSSRIKLMSSLDIAERRLPQDGHFKLRLGKGREMDFRVRVLPTIWGEKLVLRLLDKGNHQLDMAKLGFALKPLEDIKWAVNRRRGMTLFTGPGGSGKTTTLYSALSELNKPGNNIGTVEDPVERGIVGINQVQIDAAVGLDFAKALRSLLRQDLDIIMMSEISDLQTCELALKACCHQMVLSTLQADDAATALTLLWKMGIEPSPITASVNLVVSQRLARMCCGDCKVVNGDLKVLEEYGFTPDQLAGVQFYKGAGCKHCNGSGYKGRVALFEVMRFTDPLKELVLQRASSRELKTAAIQGGMVCMRMAGMLKVIEGITTVEEVMRVTD
jgi:type IV pilus assembly protein PilB